MCVYHDSGSSLSTARGLPHLDRGGAETASAGALPARPDFAISRSLCALANGFIIVQLLGFGATGALKKPANGHYVEAE